MASAMLMALLAWMHNIKDLQAPGGKAAATETNHKLPAYPLCRMFTFLSQCNKKYTSFTEPGGLRGEPVVRRLAPPRPWGMLYLAYQMQSDIMTPVRSWASAAANSGMAPLVADHPALRNLTAVYELIARAGLTHMRPPFGIDSITVDGREVEVREKVAARTPFATLLHFSKDIAAAQPRVLLVAPLSGHFSTLLRATVRTMLQDHDVFVTDWHNARDIPLTAGRFGVDGYTDHLIKFLEVIGPPAHILAVCQPCVAVLAAVAVMAQAAHPAQPRSMTLMAGPIDTRVNPTKVNELAKKRSINWFERTLTASVPVRYPGAFRRVYPGFVQLIAFMSMNIERHVKAHRELYEHLANGEFEKAAVTKLFYDEYFAVLDLTAEFYLETVQLIFQDHALPLGRLEWHGQRVDPNAIRKTMLFTVEGERDDICAVGQTMAAHELCGKLRPYLKRHHMQAGVGHYGVFSGKRWESQIYPILKNVILSSE
jgi:polyhydroxyalkanoate depolymerase